MPRILTDPQMLYVLKLWNSRFFILNLVASDLRTRYRKSFLGLIWVLLFPLSLTIMLTFIMSKVFHQVVATYSSYVFIGLVMWDFLVQSSNYGGGSYINSEAYIKQYPRPLLIYPIRAVLVCFINSSIALVGAAIWSAIVGSHFPNFSWLTLPISIMLGFLWALTFAITMGYLTTIFRDIGQISLLVFQLIWYLSPVFLPIEIFKNKNLPSQILEWNPMFHYLELFRKPLMANESPSTTNFLFVIGTIIFLTIPAILFQIKAEKKVIHYL